MTFNQHTAKTNSHRSKDNEQPPFSNATCSCELAVRYPIFEKQRSCVCTTITLSHRFKTSLNVGRTITGLGTKVGNVTKKLFCRVLNRSPGVERVAALRLLFDSFCRSKKNVKPFPFGNFRGFANLKSAHTGGSLHKPN